VTPDPQTRSAAIIAKARENAAARAAQAPHCHWTWERGSYRSPWFWPTQADAEHASQVFPALGAEGEPRVFAIHTQHCMCPEEEEVPA
jgi:hypothetical protein